jgi:hypothetical protein
MGSVRVRDNETVLLEDGIGIDDGLGAAESHGEFSGEAVSEVVIDPILPAASLGEPLDDRDTDMVLLILSLGDEETEGVALALRVVEIDLDHDRDFVLDRVMDDVELTVAVRVTLLVRDDVRDREALARRRAPLNKWPSYLVDPAFGWSGSRVENDGKNATRFRLNSNTNTTMHDRGTIKVPRKRAKRDERMRVNTVFGKSETSWCAFRGSLVDDIVIAIDYCKTAALSYSGTTLQSCCVA